ncbi:hypothetical protein [Streptomyces sp. NBC_01768]|uniref:hypothetical protein n=1 Tax=Streptomyces sp. NBC_01768 TaxID=2975938 RepID=UPI002DD9C34C|nr:hypothetical protein [Streptomyces sp. NBC_01768]WSC31803.1 hypothetical protein OG902_36720 [Streptomyces sp. NBC_01768]
MSKYGTGVDEPYAFGGFVMLRVDEEYGESAKVDISPDEARLLGLRLIKMADEAEGQE